MQIAVLGTGRVGGALGTRWAQAGHQVIFGSRDPGGEKARELVERVGENASAATLVDAIGQGEVIVYAAPWPAAEEILRSTSDLQGKVLIDCTNPLNAEFSGLELGFDASAAEKIAEWSGGARVVKAFNTVSSYAMADPDFGEDKAAMFYCGDDDDAKQTVHQLAEEVGLSPVNAGPLQNARYLEPFAMLYIHLAVREGWGNCAFKIMKK